MPYSMYLCLALATLGRRPRGQAADPAPTLDDALRPVLDGLGQLVAALRAGPVSPAGVARFENDRHGQLRELGRLVTHWTYNQLEPAQVQALPEHVHYESS